MYIIINTLEIYIFHATDLMVTDKNNTYIVQVNLFSAYVSNIDNVSPHITCKYLFDYPSQYLLGSMDILTKSYSDYFKLDLPNIGSPGLVGRNAQWHVDEEPGREKDTAFPRVEEVGDCHVLDTTSETVIDQPVPVCMLFFPVDPKQNEMFKVTKSR